MQACTWTNLYSHINIAKQTSLYYILEWRKRWRRGIGRKTCIIIILGLLKKQVETKLTNLGITNVHKKYRRQGRDPGWLCHDS